MADASLSPYYSVACHTARTLCTSLTFDFLDDAIFHLISDYSGIDFKHFATHRCGGMPRRVVKEISRFCGINEKTHGISIFPDNNNYRYFHIQIPGPAGCPYEGGIFKMEMFLDKEYPQKPPKCRMVTKIYHPNIDQFGRISLRSLPLFLGGWSSAFSINAVCISVQRIIYV